MAEHLSAAIARTGIPVMMPTMLLTLLLSCSAEAQDLVDPMRPPVGIGQFQVDATPAGPVLQSVLISPSRRIAIISGKTVKTGDKFGDAQVVAINENEVVLKDGKSRQVLKLYPSLHEPAPTATSAHNREIPGQPR
jgi:MSHA biogenesis protein MshK